MKFFKSLIPGKSKLVSFRHLKNLLFMAKVDGEFHPLENDFLKSVAKESRGSQRKLEDVRGLYHEINVKLPQDKIERYYQLYNVIRMMMADQKIFNEERLYCRRLAKSLDFKNDIIDRLIASIEANVQAGHDIEETALRISALLKFNS